ncbi:MAG: GGDEF domain-containing protein [Deltaproteobacteria bacterium]|nr:GGDEF domain-containing protein [Deltaproteobacteria bacterium]
MGAVESVSDLYRELLPLGRDGVVPAGEELWQEGAKGETVVLLVEGTFEILQSSPSGEPVVLRLARAGEVLGEMACLDGGARSAGLRAATDCRIRTIGATQFLNFVRQRPHLLEELFRIESQRIRSLSRMVTQSQHRAITDRLTSLYNSGFFIERLDLELERAVQMGDAVSVVLFDIDHFKAYNDTHGHPAGNVVLVQVSDLLRRTARRGDIVARFGGEEFVMLLYGASRKEAQQVAEAARARVESTDFAGGETQPLGRVTISGGVACFPGDARSATDLLKAADVQLYKAKAEGRNRVDAGAEGA